MHGQAFVVFEVVDDAVKALVGSQGVELLGKNMHIEYCKSKSEAAAIADNTHMFQETGGRLGLARTANRLLKL